MKNKGFLFLVVFFLLQYFSAHTQSGFALSLDGVNDYMEVADHEDLNINIGENFTITLWIKTSVVDDFYRIVSKRTGGSGAGYEIITQSGVGAYGVNLRSTVNTNAGPPFGTTPITDGNWHHLAMVVDAENAQASIFVDGNLEQISNGTAIGSESFSNDVPFILGANNTQTLFMNALMDDVRIWQVALSNSEIQNDMSATVVGVEPNLIAVWDFENVSGNLVTEVTGSHDGVLFGGATIVSINSAMIYQESAVLTTNSPVGIGEIAERLIAVNVVTQGNIDPLVLSEIKFNLTGTSQISDLENLKIYYTGSNAKPNLATLFGTANVQNGTINSSGNQTLNEGFNHFWITCDISENATEGNVLKGELVSVTVGSQEYTPTLNQTNDQRLILLENKLLFSGGDFGSLNWRIPAVITAADGSLIVAADARVNGPGDLPNNNDIVIRRSTDMGETWSNALTIADFGEQGASDPAFVLDRNTGDLLCMFATHSGLFQSTFSNPIRFQICRSQDNGQTWSSPADFTNQIYDPSWSAAWLASGNAHQLRSGRIVGAIGVRENSGSAISNFMIFSDDGGHTWDYKPNVATPVGNEAKIVELDNSDLMMSVRNQTPNLRQIVISEDGGDTWGSPYFQPELIDPFVNGDLIRYTSILDGYNKSRLLFCISAHPTNRENLTIFLSYDEGETWSVSKSIYPGLTGYSSMTTLSDGSIGCFYENGEYENYQLYFARFSLDWLTDGVDTWSQAVSTHDLPSNVSKISIAPNPTPGPVTIEIELKKASRLKCTLFNEVGLIIDTLFEERFEEGMSYKHIDLSYLPSANYFIEIKTEGKAVVKKILVIN